MTSTMQEYMQIKAVSAGVLRTLIDECPLAAWHCSAFNPQPTEPDDTDASDAGTIIHQILLEGSTDCCVVVDPAEHPNEKGGGFAAGWTNKSIKAARDGIRADGKIPILKSKWAPIVAAVQSAQRYIESLRETEPAVWRAFQPDGGVSEDTITAEIDGVPCKIRPDRRDNECAIMVDVKTTMTSAAPERWARSQLYGGGYDLSAAFYRLVARVLDRLSEPPTYLFLVVSQSPPYLCSLVAPDPAALDLAHRKIVWALREWAKCAKSGAWPGYINRVSYVGAPGWAEAQWLEREIEDFHAKA